MPRKLATNLRFAMFPVVTHQSFNVKKQFSHKEKKSFNKIIRAESASETLGTSNFSSF